MLNGRWGPLILLSFGGQSRGDDLSFGLYLASSCLSGNNTGLVTTDTELRREDREREYIQVHTGRRVGAGPVVVVVAVGALGQTSLRRLVVSICRHWCRARRPQQCVGREILDVEPSLRREL